MSAMSGHYQIDNTKLNGKSSSHEKSSLTNRTFRAALPQILATCAKNLLLLTYGMTLGLTAIAIPALQMGKDNNSTNNENGLRTDYLKLNEDQISWFSSINLICVPLGCFISGVVTQPFGRKRSMMALNIPFLMVWILFYNANSVTMLYIALVICGLTGGLHEAPVITYVAEITEPYLRGMLGSTSSTTVIIGSVSQLILGNFFHWRTVVCINMFFPITAFIALSFVPESPYWLIGKGRIKDAEKSLCWLRGWVQPEVVHQELSLLVKHIEMQKKQHQPTFKYMIKRYSNRTFLLPFFVIAVIFMCGHFGGMMSLQTNAVRLFEVLGTSMDPYKATLILGVMELAGAILCVISVHWTGKRPLLIISTSLTGICLIILAAYSYCRIVNPEAVTNLNWIPVVFLNSSAFLLHAGIRLLPWVLIGEMYPDSIRSMATGASAFCFYVFAFAANKSFYWMLHTIRIDGLMLFYSIFISFGSVFIYYFLPETEGRTLEDIQRHFADKDNTFNTRVDKQLIAYYEKDIALPKSNNSSSTSSSSQNEQTLTAIVAATDS